MQMQQELSRDMKYMARLEPFLVSMEQFGQLTEDIMLFSSSSDSMAYVWVRLTSMILRPIILLTSTLTLAQGPMKFILDVRLTTRPRS